MSQPPSEQTSFRDGIATAERSGRRIWVFPAKPKGRLYRARTLVSVLLLAFLFGAPFLKLNGQPILLFNVVERKFFVFGLAFWPQDFHLLLLATIAFVVFIVLFTAVFGRLFCGWICPQTVFLEMVFRRFEYWIDGGPARQRKLAKSPMSAEKLFKRVVKHGAFFAISFLIGNTFLAYIVGVDQLGQLVTASPLRHFGLFAAVLVFSGLFYFVFSWFREQACTLVCPYGRLQGVLIDSNSIIVAYDHVRGEPRRPMGRDGKETGAGDCVECNACVAVCPTGIDIRNGTQLECVNCTACIDACNRTMRKVGLPEGLIRYSSEDAVAHRRKFKLTGRIVLYSVIFVALATLLTVLLATRAPVETTILRTPGMLYQETDNGLIRNLYSVKVVNKTFDAVPVSFEVKSPAGGRVTVVGAAIEAGPDGLVESAIFVDIPRSSLFSSSSGVVIDVLVDGEVIESIRTSFSGPKPERRQ